MKKRKVIGWVLFGWGAIGFIMAVSISIPMGWQMWQSAPPYGPQHDAAFQAILYPLVNSLVCIAFMIGGWKLKQSAKVKA